MFGINTGLRAEKTRAAMVAMLLFVSVMPAAAGDPGTGMAPAPALLSEQRAVELALDGNPGLAAIQSRAVALSGIPPQAGTLADPRLSFNMLNLPVDSFSLTQEPMTQLQVGLSQALPFPGKLDLKAEIATHLANAALADAEEAGIALAAGVRRAWWELFYIDRALDTVRRNQSLMRRLVAVAQSKYRTGQGLQQDVLLAQLELSRLLDTEIRVKAMRRTAVERLNVLMDRPSGTAVMLPARVSETLPELEDEEYYRDLAAGRSRLVAQASRLEAARSRVALAERDYYPDFRVAAGYGVRRGTRAGGDDLPDLASLMVSMNLPLHTAARQDNAVDQRQAELMREEFVLRDLRNRIAEEVALAVVDYRRARQQSGLLADGILPQARQTVDSMLAGYKVNKVDFLNLVRAQIALYEYETRYWRALSEAHQALAQLAAAVGREKVL